MRLFSVINLNIKNFYLGILAPALFFAGAVVCNGSAVQAQVAEGVTTAVGSALSSAVGSTIDPAGSPLYNATGLAGISAIDGTTGMLADQAAARQAEEERLARRQEQLDNPDSAVSKAYSLAEKTSKAKDKQKMFFKFDGTLEEEPVVSVPPNIEALQNINKSFIGDGNSLSDDLINKKISLDMRRDAQKEAALSYGARGGLAKRNHQIMERMKGFDAVLDRVFNFRALLITAPSGLLIEPPIVKEALDAIIIKDGGNEAAVAEGVFDINKNARIVSAPRDWRHYIVQEWSEVPPPPRVLWPNNEKEQVNWNIWVEQGWRAGVEQAEEMFELNVNRLSADYSGMVRYRVLLAQGMISAPYAMHEDRGVTGSENQMRIGDSALKITGPSQFITGANRWKPADQ